jgi:hypothetical protein
MHEPSIPATPIGIGHTSIPINELAADSRAR